ncbi:putative WASH complex subunit CCDC53 isoform X2 [Apostichopus japonicus]|uniref:WASH complex subunit 3 n=1 Tax=Stichopus japonicus TaxID=307972 RepID=A0A2G8KYY5_STIJA|nr:putative WASH complex subunit CCDC53 isoform X2 [Apostichopus japonicus]
MHQAPRFYIPIRLTRVSPAVSDHFFANTARSEVTAIHPKRMLAFLNHFIIHTTRFLNKFSCVCEQKLLDLNHRIQKLEVTMNILEAKLASIPGLENVTVEQATPQQPPATNLPAVTAGDDQHIFNYEALVCSKSYLGNRASTARSPPTLTVLQDPRYMKYFKMINMGVPIEPLRNKVLMDGLDPNLLSTPDAPAPPLTQQESSESSFGSEESDNDEFSD